MTLSLLECVGFGARSGAVSTVTRDWARELAGEAQKRSCGFLDAPVGGSRQAAVAGQLTFFVGGDAHTFEEARPALEAVGQRINHLGPVGSGATWKLINNALIATQVAALAEVLEWARKSGFTPEQITALISGGSMASPIVQVKLLSRIRPGSARLKRGAGSRRK